MSLPQSEEDILREGEAATAGVQELVAGGQVEHLAGWEADLWPPGACGVQRRARGGPSAVSRSLGTLGRGVCRTQNRTLCNQKFNSKVKSTIKVWKINLKMSSKKYKTDKQIENQREKVKRKGRDLAKKARHPSSGNPGPEAPGLAGLRGSLHG